jgi:hypothetical protein
MNPCQFEVYLAANTAGTGTMVANTQAMIRNPDRQHRQTSPRQPSPVRCPQQPRASFQTSEQLGYGDPSNGEFKSLAVVLCFLLFSPQKATKRTKKKGIGSALLEGPFGHFF